MAGRRIGLGVVVAAAVLALTGVPSGCDSTPTEPNGNGRFSPTPTFTSTPLLHDARGDADAAHARAGDADTGPHGHAADGHAHVRTGRDPRDGDAHARSRDPDADTAAADVDARDAGADEHAVRGHADADAPLSRQAGSRFLLVPVGLEQMDLMHPHQSPT